MVGTGAPGLFFVQISRQLIVAAVLLMILVSILCELHEVRDSFHSEGQVKMGQCYIMGPSWTFVFFALEGIWLDDFFVFFFTSDVLFVDFVGDFCRGFANNKWEARWNVNTGGVPFEIWGKMIVKQEILRYLLSTLFGFKPFDASVAVKRSVPRRFCFMTGVPRFTCTRRGQETIPRGGSVIFGERFWWDRKLLVHPSAQNWSGITVLFLNCALFIEVRGEDASMEELRTTSGSANGLSVYPQIGHGHFIGSQWLCIYNLYNLFRGYPVFRAKVRPWRDFLQAHNKSSRSKELYGRCWPVCQPLVVSI